PDPIFRIPHLYPRVPGWFAQHAPGVDHRHLLRHRDRISCCAGPAIAELAAVAHLGRLCRTDTQSATAVPDLVLVSRRAQRAAKPAAKHFVIWQLLSFQPGSRGSEADRPRRSGAVRAGDPGCDRRLLAVAALRAPAAVRERQIGHDLALCGGPADRAAAPDRAYIRGAGHV